jgi:hypothetical protein
VATADGRLSFPAGRGRAWNVATVPSLLAQWCTLVAVLMIGWRVRSVRHRAEAEPNGAAGAAESLEEHHL